MTHVGKQNDRRALARELFWGIVPFAVGIVVLGWLWFTLDTRIFGDLRHTRFLTPPPVFKVTALTYALFCASIAVVTAGTAVYVFQFTKNFDSKDTDGRAQLNAAHGLGVASIIVLLGGVVLWLFTSYYGTKEVCRGADLLRSFHFHDVFVMAVFLLFIPMDWLTIKGLNLAANDKDITESRRKEHCLALDFAKAQLVLIDIPVFLGTIALFIFVYLLEQSQYLIMFDGEFVTFPRMAGWGASCYGRPLNVEQFLGNTFIAGVGMGSLAAQIFVSQAVFVTLGLFFRYQRAVGRPLDVAPQV